MADVIPVINPALNGKWSFYYGITQYSIYTSSSTITRIKIPKYQWYFTLVCTPCKAEPEYRGNERAN